MGRRALVLLAAAGLGLSAGACKEGDTLSSGVAPAIAGFVPATVPPGSTSRLVSIRTASVDGGRIVLEFVVTEVDELVAGIALKLTYPAAFSRFVRCTDGDLFPPDDCLFSEPGVGSGEVFIGRSVLGAGQATTVVGDRVIVRAEFVVFGTGSGPITIEGQNLGGGDVSAVLDLDTQPIFVEWFSGDLTGS